MNKHRLSQSKTLRHPEDPGKRCHIAPTLPAPTLQANKCVNDARLHTSSWKTSAKGITHVSYLKAETN